MEFCCQTVVNLGNTKIGSCKQVANAEAASSETYSRNGRVAAGKRHPLFAEPGADGAAVHARGRRGLQPGVLLPA